MVTPALVGFSMGGYRALALAPLVNARSVLVLAGFAELSLEERAGLKAFADALRAGVDVKPLLPPRFLSAAHRASSPEDDAKVMAWRDCATTATLIEELDDSFELPSIMSVLEALSCPVIARAGELDQAVPPAHATAIASRAKHGRVDLVPGRGHALYLEDRAGTLAAIRAAAG